MSDDYIELGCDELHTPAMLWHEFIHKFLFEDFDLESCRMWDNIADDLQKYLFNLDIQDRPYIYTAPTARAKSVDDGAWASGKRKQREKSVYTGWKPDTTKRTPIRPLRDIVLVTTSVTHIYVRKNIRG